MTSDRLACSYELVTFGVTATEVGVSSVVVWPEGFSGGNFDSSI